MSRPIVTVRELREKYLRFFASKGHLIHDSGSLIPYDVTGRLDESLLFNGAGMVQFKPYFRGVATPPQTRLTTAQKCVRTGDIDEVGDDSHLTFFEMLGNFSFGDYFKKEAIDYSWEFLTSPDWLGLDPSRLSFTVFEEDQEAYDCWAAHLSAAGIDPSIRIFKLGDETNYWPAGSFTKGPPGPCGPNSEMFYWQGAGDPPSAPYSSADWLKDDDAKNWLEIWNDVFIQYEWQGTEGSDGWVKTGMPNLPFNSIDTGMGIERTVAVLNGYKSVYETDAFSAIFAKLDELCSPSPQEKRGLGGEATAARRIIADHIRTACFCIADGILPANNGRGYVLRRLIRRAVLKGQRTLGFNDLFMHQVAEAVFETFGDHYKELAERKDIIVETLKSEEELFRRTLKRGSELLEEALSDLSGQSVLAGSTAFQLYDTFGFPLEVTQELCAEARITVDLDGFNKAMQEAQERSRGAQGDKSAYGDLSESDQFYERVMEIERQYDPYSYVNSENGFRTRIIGVRISKERASTIDLEALETIPNSGSYRVEIKLETDPVYFNSGGQMSDGGFVDLENSTTRFEIPVRAARVTKEWIAVLSPFDPSDCTHEVGEDIESESDFVSPQLNTWQSLEPVDALAHLADRYLGKSVLIQLTTRAAGQRHHTATHLLQASLRHHLGTTVNQAGSYNGPENLRFDFTHGKALSQEEIQKVEQTVNEEILKNTPVVTYADLPIAEAKAKGAMALFGEKYGDKVRMVEIGEFSKELCGGTHVRTTGEIGLFKIVSESSAASGVRRIEAVCGEAAYALVNQQQSDLKEAAALLKTNPKEIVQAVEKTLEQLKEERKKREKAEMAAMSGESTKQETTNINGIELWVKNFGDADQKVASQAIDNEANGKPSQVTLGAVVGEKITFMCKVGPDALAKGAHAGNILREVAKIAGGGGGGQAAFATAGGRDATKVEEALSAAAAILAAQLSS